MTIATGQKIQASDYNVIYNKIDAVMGVNNDGYGQVVSSSSQSLNADISLAVWNNLRNDLIKSRYHQTGVDPSGSLTAVTSADKISFTVWNQANALADVITTNKRAVASNQGSIETITGGNSTISNWNVSISHTVTIDFGSNTAARYFFNAGGDIRIRAYRSGTAANNKDSAWTSMLGDNATIKGQGTIYMNYTLTDTVDGSYDTSPTDQRGTGSAIGFYDLTATNQQIYIKNAPSGAYSENYYQIQARVNTASNPSQVIITVNFVDADTGGPALPPAPGSSPGQPPGPTIDDVVTGTTGSVVTVFRPSGSNVSVASPSGSSVGLSGS
jgi:hypothetical protein